MKLRFNLLFIIYGFWLISAITPIFSLSTIAKETFKINLDQELKKGNFLIGLKQYLGANVDSLSGNKKLTFETKNNFLTLHSSNGVKYKAKKINILWQSVPLEIPYNIERLVFGPFASYESAQKKAIRLKEEGYNPQIVYPKDWEVWIPVEKELPSKKLNYQLFKKSYNSEIVPFFVDEYSEQKLEGPIYISSDDEIIINGVSVGSQFYLAKDSYGTWTLIQKIEIDDYLKGVIPHEIGSSSPLEALKAQAVIARTWAIYNSGRFNADQYHLCVTTQCQVYKTPKTEDRNVQIAIEETSNLIITFESQPINSFYHGSNGGIAASASESWKIEDYSYLKPMIDGLDSLKKSFKLPIKNANELNNFFDYSNKKVYGDNHSLFRWKKILSSEKIQDYLILNQIIENKVDFIDVVIIDRGSSGRVTKLEIKLSTYNKPIVLEKDDIRSKLSFLPSNLFTINKLSDNLWLFRGGGFGHGVGLSQAGAIEMAELGFTYEQILNHYYPGTIIKKIEIMSQ